MSERTFTLCEFSFVPYPHSEENPKFALGADVYAYIPHDSQKKYHDKNHALAIWLDIETQEFVVRKEYCEVVLINPRKISLNSVQMLMFSNKLTNNFQEVYRGKDFQEALNMCTILSNKYWDSETRWTSCSHNHESYCCKKYKDNHAYRGD